MNETVVSNTGPMRHLFEIGQIQTLTLFSDIYFPKQVKDELLAQGVWGSLESTIGGHLHVENVADSDVDAKLATFAPFKLHRADASEFTNDEASYGYFSCGTLKAQCSANG